MQRTHHTLRLGGASLLVLSLLGCGGNVVVDGFSDGSSGSSCVKLCEEQNACEGATPQDCSALCAESDKIASESGCKTQADEYTTCADALPDICKFSLDDCQTEISAYVGCFTLFCMENMDAEICQP